MQNLKELFSEIKSIFVDEGVELKEEVANETTETPKELTEETSKEITEPTTERFEDVVLSDGSVAQIEPEVIVGAAVVVDVEGELVPAPDGEHELSDGRKIVTESGVIVEVIEVEEDAEAEAEEEEQEEMEKESPLSEAQERAAKKIIESIVTERVFSMEATISEENKELKNELNKLKEAFSKLIELTEGLINEPKAEAVKKNKSGFSSLRKNKKADLIERLKNKNIIN